MRKRARARYSYCSIAWGSKLAALANPSVAAKVLRALDAPGLTTREAALRRWIDQVVAGPNGTGAAQVDALRAAGFSEREVFEATVYVAFRVAFATVNDAFGARPDAQLLAAVTARGACGGDVRPIAIQRNDEASWAPRSAPQ